MQQWFQDESRACFVVAEIGQAHDGSLGMAHAYIDAVADAGAHAIKFQTHLAHAESTPGEPWRVKFSKQDDRRYDYWKRMEFTADQWAGLAEHATAREIVFLSSAFSEEAVELLDGLAMPAWKIGSGEVTNDAMLRRMARTGKPLLLSSGMSTWAELDRAVAIIREEQADFLVFQCTSEYPTPAHHLGLNVLAQLRERYGCPVGLSDHSGTIYPSLAAAALGADMIELHVTWSKQCFGPDVPASVTLPELASVVEGVAFLQEAYRTPVDKDAAAERLGALKQMFEKSIVLREERPAGTTLTAADLTLKKPGTGLPAAQLEQVIGRRLQRDVAADTLLSEQDLE